MLTEKQIITLYDYVILFKSYAKMLATQARNNNENCKEFQSVLVQEQTRRARELKRLETALAKEIESFESWEGSNATCADTTARTRTHRKNQEPMRKKKPTGEKSKKLAAGICISDSNAKNANASSGKRKPGRPRKTAATE